MKSPALAGTLVQLGVAFPMGLAILFLGEVELAYSFALGALIFIVPNVYFTLYAFRYRGARSAARIVRSFNWGELGKFALVAVGFALVFRFVTPLRPLAIFAGFSCMIVLHWWLASYLQKQWLQRLTQP